MNFGGVAAEAGGAVEVAVCGLDKFSQRTLAVATGEGVQDRKLAIKRYRKDGAPAKRSEDSGRAVKPLIGGGLYLLLYWELKRSRFSLIYDRLPPLEDLARMSMRATLFGVVFLTVTIACGSLWASVEFPGFVRDPKFLFTLVVWSIYAAAAWLHYGRNWSGRKAIRITLVGFAALVLSGLAARLFFDSFHDFA